MANHPALLAALVTATSLMGCSGCSKKDEPPPPMPTAPPENSTTAPPPPPATTPSAMQLQPVPPAPGQAPNTLGEAIMFSKPQMRDSPSGPDEGSATLTRYWLAKSYPWAQLEAVPLTPAATALASSEPERAKRVCVEGVIQTISKVSTTPPNQFEGMMTSKDGEQVSFGAVGDATGMNPNGKGRFCGVFSGVQTITTPAGQPGRALRLTGMFDTPGNRGGGAGQFANLRACCAALQQNAASTPPPQNMYMLAAAQYCNGAVAAVSSPQQKDAMISAIRGMLRGAPMPGGCRLPPRAPREPGGWASRGPRPPAAAPTEARV